jgi:hypothetical protein
MAGERVARECARLWARTIDAVRMTRAMVSVTIFLVEAVTNPRSANRATVVRVGKTPPPLSLRLGRAGTRALENLAQMREVSKAEAARQAIEETAEREERRSGLAVEARRLAVDPAYVKEAREIVAELEDLRASW